MRVKYNIYIFSYQIEQQSIVKQEEVYLYCHTLTTAVGVEKMLQRIHSHKENREKTDKQKNSPFKLCVMAGGVRQ